MLLPSGSLAKWIRKGGYFYLAKIKGVTYTMSNVLLILRVCVTPLIIANWKRASFVFNFYNRTTGYHAAPGVEYHKHMPYLWCTGDEAEYPSEYKHDVTSRVVAVHCKGIEHAQVAVDADHHQDE